jgi:hypothetical protein
LIPFDLEKRLILARSPNCSMNFDALHRLELDEGDRIFEYELIYEKVEPMREGKTWAINALRGGVNWEHNHILNLRTRETPYTLK